MSFPKEGYTKETNILIHVYTQLVVYSMDMNQNYICYTFPS